MRRALALLVLLSVAPAAAAAQQEAPKAFVVLRGPQAPASAQAPAAAAGDAAAAAPMMSPIPAETDVGRVLGFAPQAAPRVSGFSSGGRGGGAECRMSCAQTYYICLSAEYGDECGRSWNRCLSACPDISGRL